jgi:hypothetical protein
LDDSSIDKTISDLKANKNLDKITIKMCPTTFHAFEKILNPKFVAWIDGTFDWCLEIYLQIDELLNPINNDQIQLMSRKIKNGKCVLISFESIITKMRSIYWRMRGQKYFCNLICDHAACLQDEIETLGKFLCTFLVHSMENDHIGEFLMKLNNKKITVVKP